MGHKSIHAALFSGGNYFFVDMLAVTVTAFNFQGINHYLMQFKQVKCTLSGSYTDTVFNFRGTISAIRAGIVT